MRRVFILKDLPSGSGSAVYTKTDTYNVFDFLKRKITLKVPVYVDVRVFLDILSEVLISKDCPIKVVSPEEIEQMLSEEDRLLILRKDTLFEFERK